jgi:hypothetical protein
MNKIVKLSDETSNGGKESIETSFPYVATVQVRGTADFLYHAWNCEAVETKAKAAKNSAAKKTDNLESYVYRDAKGYLSIPGDYLRGATILAAKFKQDPRSPRKSAMDLFSAALVSLTPRASLGVKEWDYEDRRRVVVQRQGITRVRPAMRVGWSCEFRVMITLPEYVDRDMLHEVMSLAGRIGGLGDNRPTYGRFSIVRFDVSDA